MKNKISDAKCIVIKVGSSLLVDHQTNNLNKKWLESFILDVAQHWMLNKDIVIVSSGAVALGRFSLQLKKNMIDLNKQTFAAIGQIMLAHAYQNALSHHGIKTAQMLITMDDFNNKERCLNTTHTLKTLLKTRIIPIINENDVVATAENCFGDNDRLSANIAQMIEADTLVLLSDINGLYTADPHEDSTAEFISEIKELTPDIFAMAGNSISEYGSGGMVTKLEAAKIALASNCRMVISAGHHLYPLSRIDKSKNTWFTPQPQKNRLLLNDLIA